MVASVDRQVCEWKTIWHDLCDAMGVDYCDVLEAVAAVFLKKWPFFSEELQFVSEIYVTKSR